MPGDMSRYFLGVLLAGLVFACLSPVLQNRFTVYDDPEYVTENPHVNTGLNRQNAAWALTAAHSSNWHPLTWMSHALDCSIFGLSPRDHHLTSLLLHAFNTLLLFLWLSGATGSMVRSVFVALVFGLHPLHIESVAWVSERKDVLSTFFGLLVLLAYTAYAKRPGVARYAAVAICFAASLLSKQMLVTLPVVLLLLDCWPLGRKGPRGRLILEKLPLLALSAFAAAATIWAQRLAGSVSGIEQLPIGFRLANAVVSYAAYLVKTLWPVNLAVFYPFPVSIPAWKIAASGLAILAVSFAAVAARRRYPWIAVGWFWYLITLLPVIGIVQVGMQAMADRYMYIPMIGLLVATAWSFSGRVAAAAGAVAVVACAIVSWRQLPVWKDGVALFTHAIAVTENNFVAHDNLGIEFDRRGRYDEALEHYRGTLRIKPGDRHGEANYAQANFDKGERLFAAGKLDDALAVFREGLRYRPRNALAHAGTGLILSQQQQLPAAIAALRRAVEIDPTLAKAHMGLGVALAWSGKPAEARKSFEDTLRYDPKNVEAHYDLGMVMAALGDERKALDLFDEALKIKPDFAPALVTRVEALFAMGRYDDAWRALNAARAARVEIDPRLVAALTARVRR
jgi:protein O-mannosyl-transferase